MTTDRDRRAELIAAAAADELTDTERAEMRALAEADPTVGTEVDEYRDFMAALAHAVPNVRWDEADPSEGLRERVIAAKRTSNHPMRWAAAAAVVGIAVGAASVLGFEAATDKSITGPPGTLGAFEEIAFTGVPSGIDIDGGLVAHTWGTETVLEMDGVPAGRSYEVVVIEQSGATRTSGTFLGSTVAIDCRLNAAVLREDVSGVEIRGSDGSVLAAATVSRPT